MRNYCHEEYQTYYEISLLNGEEPLSYTEYLERKLNRLIRQAEFKEKYSSMRYWEDLNNRQGFDYGTALPDDAVIYREMWIEIVNGVAEHFGSKCRVIATDIDAFSQNQVRVGFVRYKTVPEDFDGNNFKMAKRRGNHNYERIGEEDFDQPFRDAITYVREHASEIVDRLVYGVHVVTVTTLAKDYRQAIEHVILKSTEEVPICSKCGSRIPEEYKLWEDLVGLQEIECSVCKTKLSLGDFCYVNYTNLRAEERDYLPFPNDWGW
jgi:hypothetical protein